MNAPVAHRALLGAALTAALFAAGINVAQSQNEPTPAYPAAEKHKPTTLPDRIALTNEADPSNSQSVTWRTDTTVKSAQAQIAKSTGGPGFKASATTVLATRNVQQTSSLGAETVFHTVRFTGLEPETKYLYRVGDGTNWGEWLEFETAAATYKPFSFVYLGDAQNDIQEHWSRLVRQAFKDAPEAKLTVHAGDLVDTSSNDGQWGEWFKANSFIPAMQNNIATPGNHEYSGTTLAPYWRTQFAFPDNGPTQGTAAVIDALKGTVFYSDYQGVRFISLNSNVSAVASALRPEFLEVQRAWLEGVLQNNPNKWTVATFHHPMFSTAEGRNNPSQRASWLPVFERYGVDLVLQGHDHSYGRGNMAEGTTTQTGTSIYVVSVSGPKMYEANDLNWTTNGAIAKKIGMNTQLFQVISLDGDKLYLQVQGRQRRALRRLHDHQARQRAEGDHGEPRERQARRAWAAPSPTRSRSPSTARRAWAPSPRASPRTTRRPSRSRSPARRLTPRCRSSIRRRPAPASSSTARSRSSSRCRPR